jgi:putative ABC transport system permease protein
MTGLLVDLRSASRQLVRNRGLSVVALASLAIGVGVSVAITSISTSVLVRSLPYQRPEDLVMVWGAYEPRAELAAFWDSRELARGVLTPARVQQWRDRHPFEDFAVLESWQTSPWLRADLIDGRKVERLRGTFATANIFGLLGVRPALGRSFVDGETDVAVISDSLWRRRFGADPGIVGRAVTLEIGRLHDRRPVSILGVLPPGVRFTYPEETELWMPLTWADIASYPGSALAYRIVARLRGDVSLETAEAALEAFRDRTARNSNADRVWLEPMHDYAVGTSRRMLLLISALGLLVLLSGAVNASTVFAASAVSRIREMRVRRSLGASQRRLLRQVFVEAALVALIAGAVGLGTIAAALPAMRALLPPGTPGTEAIGLDWLTLSGVAGAAALSTLVAGAIPAWLSVRDREHRQLEDTHTATTSKNGVRLRGALVGIQFALVSALLIAGSMLVTSFWNLMHVDKGFEADERVYVTQLELVNNAYRDKSFDRYERELLRRVRELDYVQAATITSAIPLRGRDVVNRIRRPDGQVIHVNVRHVDPGYFNVMGMRLLNGRLLTEADANPNSWVAVVSQSLAEQLHPGGDSVGRFLEGNSGTEIVGVVADVRARSLLEPPNPA